MNMKQARCNYSYCYTILRIFLFFCFCLTSANASQPPAEPPAADWIAGPTHVDLGEKLAEQDGQEIVNHNVRLLGRQGYISVVLVADVPTLDASMAELDAIVSNVTYKKGKSYTEYVKGDKVAKYGLTALIAGGSAAAAAKFGLFKFLGKAWKVIVIGALGVLAALKKTLKSAFGGKKKTATA